MAGTHPYNCDFHIHTPVSKCYKDSSVTPEAIIKAALGRGLDAIAITDHNSIEGIPGVVSAAAGTGLVVFPGFELTAQGGHIVAIFDPDTNLGRLDDALTSCGIEKEKRSREEAMGVPFLEALDIIVDNYGGIAFAAHADGPKGFIETIDQGQLRIKILKHKNLLALELIDLANRSKYANYEGRKIPCIQNSDAHRLEDIGGRSTLITMQHRTANGLLHAFNFPETRIDFPNLRAVVPYPYIIGMKVDRGFLADQIIEFNQNFNCLLGGTGSGKSTVIEFLRFAFDQISEDEDVRKDTLGKLKDLAGIGATIQVRFVDGKGQEYLLSRVYDGAENPTFLRKVDNTSRLDLDLKEYYPVLAYSQGETLSIARNRRAQLDLTECVNDLRQLV